MTFMDSVKYIEKVENDLRQYCEKIVIPKYIEKNDKFDLNHLRSTVSMSLKLAKELMLDYNICYAMSVLNEMSYNSNDKNNFDTLVLLTNEIQLNKYFSDADIDIIISACKEFEGESKERKIFSSLYSKVLADADSMKEIDIEYLFMVYWNKYQETIDNEEDLFKQVTDKIKIDLDHQRSTKFILKASYNISIQNYRDNIKLFQHNDKILEIMNKLLLDGKILQKNNKSTLNPNFKKDLLNSNEKELLTDIEEDVGRLFFISTVDLNQKVLSPIVPNNIMVQNGFEDRTTKRISFYSTIDGAVLSKTIAAANEKYFIFEPESYDDLQIKEVTNEMKPSATITGEKWVLNPTKLSMVGELKLTEKITPALTYSYGDNIGELHRWNYELETPNTGSSKSTISEDTTLDTESINEAFLFSKKDYYHNVNDWINGNTNILFIIGLSGSGKTSISKKIAKDNNALLIEMDTLFDWDRLEEENKNNPDDYWFERLCNTKTIELMEKYKDYNGKVIIEGLYPLQLQYPEDLKVFSLIILRKSVLKSSVKSVIRDRSHFPRLNDKIKYFMNRLDLNKQADDGIDFLLDVINEDTALDIVFNEEAKTQSKRSKAEKLMYKVLNTLDPSGINLQKYKEFFSSMTDAEFDKYMKDFLNDDEENFYLEILPNKNEPSLEQITDALKIMKVPSEEYVYLKQDGHTSDPIRTAYKVPVGYLTIKRVQQILSKKNTYSLDINQRNMKTGQVTGDSKVARISDIESYSMVAIGADNALKEFLGARADNSTSKTDMYKDINTYGYSYLKDMDTDITENQTINTMYIHLMGAGLSNDLLKEDEIDGVNLI